MLFQDYALFPHLTAWQNACFGLKPGADRSRARWLLDLLGLQGLEQRYPHELSGGQRQRLALVRALAPQPQLLLLDEPFSNLDVDVRLRLRAELPRVLKECGVTALMVTHDPEEALAICDQVAVLSGGYWHQCAPPQQLVAQPATAFVATFVLQANVLSRDALGGLTSVNQQRACDQMQAGSDSSWLVRQEDLQLSSASSGQAQVLSREFLGYEWLYVIDVDGQRSACALAWSTTSPGVAMPAQFAGWLATPVDPRLSFGTNSSVAASPSSMINSAGAMAAPSRSSPAY